MSPATRSIALLALAALAAGGVWLGMRALTPAAEPERALAAWAHDAAPRPEPKVPVVQMPESLAPETAAPVREVAREAAAADGPIPFAVPDDAHWVEGRVIFPLETPPDERAIVVARGSKFPGTDRRTHEVEPAADGTFRVAFAPRTRNGYVRLEARYLYLEGVVEVEASEPAEEGLLLEPRVGALLEVRVTPPAGSEAELDEVAIRAFPLDDLDDRPVMPRGTEEHDDGSFTLGGVLPGYTYQLDVVSRAHCDEQLEVEGLQAGERREVEVALRRGARLTGRVIASDGTPLEKAGVRVTIESDTDFDFVGGTTDAEGSFDLRGIAPGDVSLQVDHEDHLESTLELGALADGEVREGLELRLESGAALTGVVRWPDGEPVEDAWVQVHQERPGEGFGDDTTTVRTDELGRFRVAGLRDAACTVRARARRSRDEPYWRAALEGARPSGKEMILVLQSGGSVAGRVQDDTGAPVARFRVSVHEPGDEDHPFAFRGRGPTVSDGFRSEDGTFVLEGVPDGEWVARATAPGHGASPVVPVSVPASRDVTLVVPREATLYGVVLGPDGGPEPDARVSAEQEDWSFLNENGARTEADGSYELALAPGTYEVSAQAAGRAPSPPATIDLGPAERRELELRLPRAGAVRGVLDPSLGELADRVVSLNHVDGPGWDETRTDEQGRFRFSGLGPGTYELSLNEVLEERESDGSSSITYNDLCSLTLRLAEAEERDVVLGAATSHPVRVFGRVHSDGAPLADVLVTWDPADRDDERSTRTDAGGRYELLVDGTGLFAVRSGEGWGAGVAFQVEVPEGAHAFEHDLELPAGAVGGSLTGPDGESVAEAFVCLRPVEGDDSELRHSQSLADGSFLIDHVAEGSWLVVASDAPHAWRDREARFGHRVLTVELGAGQRLTDLELRLPRPATIEGHVLQADGSAAGQALVQVNETSGRPANPWSGLVTDEAGHYVCGGLGPGTYLVQAWGERGRSGEVEVRLSEGQVHVLDLTLGE